MFEMRGLDWLVRSHMRINVGATHGTFWVVTRLCYPKVEIGRQEGRLGEETKLRRY